MQLVLCKMLPKEACLVILCCCLMHMSVIGSDICFYHMVSKDGTLSFLVSQSLAYLLYPLLGWLADVYFTRYKFILYSFITMILATLLMILAAALFLEFIEDRQFFIFEGFSVSVGLIAIGLFESTAIQFGMDQMLEASSDELSTFIHWYYWSCSVGRLLVVSCATVLFAIYSKCNIEFDLQNATDLYKDLHPQYFTITTTYALIVLSLQLVCAILGLFLLIAFKKHFTIDRTGEHPLKLIYGVLRYAWKHKCPEHRSAFTYWEEDIPPRIDLGKSKYGGPFTTEEVEDTKTFFSILLLLLSLVGFHLSSHGYSTADQLMREQCPSQEVLAVLGDPMQLTFLTVVLGVPLHQLIKNWYKGDFPIANYMLKRMGLGLLFCLLKSIVEVSIQVTMTGRKECNHFDNNTRDSCYFLAFELNIDNTCTTISNATDNTFYCDQNNTPFILLLIPYLLQGLSFLLVFMAALEFICAQAPLRLKGLLIGIWYALLAINYLLIESSELYTITRITWIIFNSVKTFLILISLIMYVFVAKRYRYRLRDEVVNEQYLVEEIYERELALAQQTNDESVHYIKSYGSCSTNT